MAAGAILAALTAAVILLTPPYLDNLRLQEYVEELARRPESAARGPDYLRIAIADRAAQLGLPVRPDQVRISASGEQLRIEVRYLVRVDIPLYAVDLHLRARSGR